MYLTKKYKLKKWCSFNDDIFFSAKDFFNKKGFLPNLVAFNKHTYEQICFVISISPDDRKFIVDDDGKPEIEIIEFANIDCSLRCCYIEKLKDKEFKIIYDDDADFDDDEETPIDNPVLKKEIINV